MKNRYLIYIALLILTLSITLGVTYSYLAAKINNRESSSTIKVESGQLSITYENNSGNIILNNIIPGDSVTKQFTLTGVNNTKANAVTTNTDLKYKIGIVIDNNTFSEGALTYTLTKDSSSSTNGKLANDATGTIKSDGTQYIGNGYFVSGANNDKHIYNLTISFPDTNEDQSIDQGASFACHLTVKENSIVEPTTFAEDSWDTIAAVVQRGQLDAYPVGSEKEIEIDGTSYTVRVANNTYPEECSGTTFSQTACGFVVEFVDIVEKRVMNEEQSSLSYNILEDLHMNSLENNNNQSIEIKMLAPEPVISSQNDGGWPATLLRTYLNGDFYNKLPNDLKKFIIDTKVISGHGINDKSNFTSTDKIYLLSTHEVWKGVNINIYEITNNDKAYNNTRQLDYYQSKEITTNNYSGAIKKYQNSNSSWWLRAATLNHDSYFHEVNIDGSNNYDFANKSNGLAPAFRIG